MKSTRLERELVESLAYVEMAKLTKRIAELEADLKANYVGPRTARARARYIEQDRKKLVFRLRGLGMHITE